MLRFGRLLARVGERVQAAALRSAGIVTVRKPASRAQGKPPQAPSWRPPSVEEVDHARGQCAVENWPQLKICRGPGKGCNNSSIARCPDCYVVPWHDKRPSAEILRAMERGDA